MMDNFKLKNGIAVGGSFKNSVGTITGTDVDASTGNYFAYTPTADTTFTFSNAPASGTATGFALSVTGVSVAAGYDIANAVYDTVSFSVAGQETVPTGVSFKPDGTKMYVTGSTSDNVNEYSLSTAWDISTASFVQSFSVVAQDGGPQKAIFKSDGTKMYILGFDSDAVYQYTLSTAFNISTASYDSVSFSVAGQDATPFGLTFSDDGTKMYIVGSTGDSVYQYTLSTAFDLSTASYDSVSFSVAGQDIFPIGVSFSNNGTKMYVVGITSDSVYQYTLSTAFDISTASYDSVSFSVAGQDGTPRDIAFKDNGTKMYIVGSTGDSVYQYTTSTSATATLTYPTSVDWPSGTAPAAPAAGETDVIAFYTDDGGTNWYGFQAGDAMA